jgi:hypothetical protein
MAAPEPSCLGRHEHEGMFWSEEEPVEPGGARKDSNGRSAAPCQSTVMLPAPLLPQLGLGQWPALVAQPSIIYRLADPTRADIDARDVALLLPGPLLTSTSLDLAGFIAAQAAALVQTGPAGAGAAGGPHPLPPSAFASVLAPPACDGWQLPCSPRAIAACAAGASGLQAPLPSPRPGHELLHAGDQLELEPDASQQQHLQLTVHGGPACTGGEAAAAAPPPCHGADKPQHPQQHRPSSSMLRRARRARAKAARQAAAHLVGPAPAATQSHACGQPMRPHSEGPAADHAASITAARPHCMLAAAGICNLGGSCVAGGAAASAAVLSPRSPRPSPPSSMGPVGGKWETEGTSATGSTEAPASGTAAHADGGDTSGGGRQQAYAGSPAGLAPASAAVLAWCHVQCAHGQLPDLGEEATKVRGSVALARSSSWHGHGAAHPAMIQAQTACPGC